MQSKFVMVGDIRTHYLEAGEGDQHLILLHGGEYGGCAETSYEYNIDALGKYFHVYAVDMIGYGFTEKLHSFENMRGLRIRHIKQFMETLCIPSASFIGNSIGGGFPLEVAAMEAPVWNIRKIITISGGGPNNSEVNKALSDYDCTREYMKRIHEFMFYQDRFKTDEYVEKRYQMSILPGAWESLSAARFRSPLAGAAQTPKHLSYSELYRNIKVPVLIVGGDSDHLKLPDYAEKLGALIPKCTIKIFENCGHCAQIEYPDEFNQAAIDFLLSD